MENLTTIFEDEGLVAPKWLLSLVDSALKRTSMTDKQKRYFIYSNIFKTLRAHRKLPPAKPYCFADELLEVIREIFPGEEQHKTIGSPNIDLKLIASIR